MKIRLLVLFLFICSNSWAEEKKEVLSAVLQFRERGSPDDTNTVAQLAYPKPYLQSVTKAFSDIIWAKGIEPIGNMQLDEQAIITIAYSTTEGEYVFAYYPEGWDANFDSSDIPKKDWIKLLNVTYDLYPQAIKDRYLLEFPRTLNEAVEVLMQKAHYDALEKLKHTPEDKIGSFHMNLGLSIRNSMGLWYPNSDLMLELKESTGDNDLPPDFASYLIIKALWTRLNKTN